MDSVKSIQRPKLNKTYVVEHLDPELEEWSALEYKTIAKECYEANGTFILSSMSADLQLPDDLRSAKGFNSDSRAVESLFPLNEHRICLLDPAAAKDLQPEDGDHFDVFLFGGILGDDPPRDRTAELRAKGFEGRRLGPVQMTTDTAVRVTRLIVQAKVPPSEIAYIDFPELKLNEHESTEMPFRYLKDAQGQPVMPQGMLELIKKDSEKDFKDLGRGHHYAIMCALSEADAHDANVQLAAALERHFVPYFRSPKIQ